LLSGSPKIHFEDFFSALHVRLGESSRQCRYQMDMIGHTADPEGFRARVAADGQR
jgi:hypothetical protein